MTLTSAISGLWIASICLQVLLGAVLLSKKTWEKFPLFTSYAFLNLVEVIVSYAARSNGPFYFRFYWSFEALTILLGLGIVYEVFRTIFVQHPALRQLASLLFTVAILGLLTVGGIVLWSKNPGDSK